MSSGDFEAELQQSVHDHLAFIANAASAAKARIGEEVQSTRPTVPAAPQPPSEARPAVDFSVPEPDFDSAFASGSDEPAEADAFAAEPAPAPLPHGAISFDDPGAEGAHDEGIPVWEDPP